VGGIWSVTGGGEDIWGTASQFRSIWRAARGDRSVTARVLSQSATSPWAKAGVILSQSADPGSPYYALFVTPEHGISVQYRPRQGGNAADLMIVPGRPPVYLRVARSGGQFSAYTSADGSSWTEVPGSRISFAVPAQLMGGLAVTSHNPAKLSTASFDSVAFSVPAT